MEFKEVIRNRYSCKNYSERQVEPEKLEAILEAGREWQCRSSDAILQKGWKHEKKNCNCSGVSADDVYGGMRKCR